MSKSIDKRINLNSAVNNAKKKREEKSLNDLRERTKSKSIDRRLAIQLEFEEWYKIRHDGTYKSTQQYPNELLKCDNENTYSVRGDLLFSYILKHRLKIQEIYKDVDNG